MSIKNLVPVNTLALASAPSTPTLNAGDMYYDTTLSALRVYTGSGWVNANTGGGSGGGIAYTFASSPPTSPNAGDMWVDSGTDITYTYVNDGTSSQWVEQVASAYVGATGATGTAATVAVGTVATGAAGSSVIVNNSGTTAAAVLDFTIPKGDTGATGGITGGTMTGTLGLVAGTTTVVPLDFQTGTNLTTPIAGGMEYDGAVPYFTANATSGRGILDSTLYATTGAFFAPGRSQTTAQPIFGGFLSTTGTLGTIAGTGPWTATITGMTAAGGYRVGTTITSTAGTGSFNTNTVTVTSIASATSITVSATGGTIPTAGTVTNITSTTTGALSLPANTEYLFELQLQGTSTGASTKIFTNAGTATFNSFHMQAFSVSAAANANTANAVTTYTTATTPSITFISTAATTAFSTLIKGSFHTNAAGTFIPSLTTGVVAGTTTISAYIKLIPMGTGTSFAVGAWA